MNKSLMAISFVSAFFLVGGCTVVSTTYDPTPVRSTVVVGQTYPAWGPRYYYGSGIGYYRPYRSSVYIGSGYRYRYGSYRYRYNRYRW